MISLMAELTDKSGWARKVLDDEIVAKWKAETMSANDESKPELVLTDKAFEYCIEELRDYATQLEETQMIPAINADGVVFKSDFLISVDLKNALRAAVAPLENLPDEQKDWHPHSDEKVLDLVHPSLFPLLYGRSTVLVEGTLPLNDCDTYIGQGDVVPVPQNKDLHVERFGGISTWAYAPQHFYSQKYQWLPCEVAFRDHDKMEINSYINNLHPRDHQPLYKVIEQVIAKAVPMWNACLARSDEHPPPRDDADGEWIEPEGERPRGIDEEDEDEIYELDDEWRNEHRVLAMPDISNEYHTRADHNTKQAPVNLRQNFASRGLQIIIKLANIHLLPEKPSYEGGS